MRAKVIQGIGTTVNREEKLGSSLDNYQLLNEIHIREAKTSNVVNPFFKFQFVNEKLYVLQDFQNLGRSG